MKGMLYLPTDRLCSRAIASGAEECAAVVRYEEPPVLAVIEHVNGGHIVEHATCLERAAGEHGLCAFHVTPVGWSAWLEQLLDEAPDIDAEDSVRLSAMLHPVGVAYGAGPNKAALVAAALGIDVLHRRDSDLVPIQREGFASLPAVLESEAIGRPACSVQSLSNASELTEAMRERVLYFVGSSYWGDPPHDRRSLLSLDRELVVRIERLSSPGSSLKELREDVQHYFEIEPATRYDEDFYELDMTGRTELGVSCLYKVFRHLPEMPATDIFGCDYFQKNVLYQLGLPVLFHSRKMSHQYTIGGARAQGIEAIVSYGLRDLRYVTLWRIWSHHNRTLRDDPARFAHGDVGLDVEAYAASFASALDEEHDGLASIAPSFAEIYEDARLMASGADAAAFMQLAAAVRSDAAEITEQVVSAVQDYIWLVRRWPDIVAAAAALGPSSLDSLRRVG